MDGLLVPREVVEASQTGSGFSGRSVPLVGFLAIRDTEFGGYVRQINSQSLKPMALANYGPGADDYDLVPVPLLETTGELMGGIGRPDPNTPGGDGAEGKGQEAGGVEGDAPRGPGMQTAGQRSSMQFGGATLWDEDDHPRADDGKWVEKDGGKSRASIAGEEFRLTNRKSKQRFENVKTKQKKLLEGMDALPGQQDLFGPEKSPAEPVEKRSYTTFKHPEEGHIDLRRLQLRRHGSGLELLETYKDQLHATPVPHEEAGFAALHQRIEQLKKEGWRHHEGPAGGPMQFSAADDSGHWITIGAVRGDDGKKHGGTPVKIVGGKIVSGPKRLRGKSIKRLASGKPNHEVEYRRAVRKAVKEHGVKESDLHDAVEFVHGEKKIHHDAYEKAKEEARKLTGLTAGDVAELAKSHPELNLGNPDAGDNVSDSLWGVLGEGKRSMVAKHDPEVIDEAVRLIHASGGHHYADEDLEAIPFSTDANGMEHEPAGSPKGGEFKSKTALDMKHGASVGRTGGKMTLYRASDDDYIGDSASFATSRESAEAYLDNPGFGGGSLYKTNVDIDPLKALDLHDSRDPLSDLVKFLGIPHPGAIGADEFVPRVSDKLRDAGIDWVRVMDSFPEEAETWIFVGGEEPELREIQFSEAASFSAEFESKHARGQPENKGEFSRKGTTYVSPNRKEGTGLRDALKMAQNSEVRENRNHVADVTRELVKKVRTTQGIGSWKDGAEPSFIFRLNGVRDFSELKYISAWQGLLLEQKASLAFLHDGTHGKNLLWTISVTGTIEDVVDKLDRSKLANVPRTISQAAADIMLVQVFDPNGDPKLMDRLGEWSVKHGANINATLGHGRVIPAGGSNRAKSFDNFRAIIRGYEEVAPHDRIVRSAWARDMLRGGIAGARLRGRKRRRVDEQQFSIADPPNRDRATSQPAKAKDAAAATAPALADEIRRRLKRLLKKN